MFPNHLLHKLPPPFHPHTVKIVSSISCILNAYTIQRYCYEYNCFTFHSQYLSLLTSKPLACEDYCPDFRLKNNADTPSRSLTLTYRYVIANWFIISEISAWKKWIKGGWSESERGIGSILQRLRLTVVSSASGCPLNDWNDKDFSSAQVCMFD